MWQACLSDSHRKNSRLDEPLQGALITVAEQQAVATTDVDGMCLIEGQLPVWLTISCLLNGQVVADNQRHEFRESEELEAYFSLTTYRPKHNPAFALA